jgi:hypothetical protein
MKTTRNSIAIEAYSAPAPPNSIALEINYNNTRGNNKSYFSLLLAKIFFLCSLGIILLSACEKTDELTPSTSDTKLNLKAAVAAYYIAPNGSDAANGDINHPFFTLNKAWSVVSAGDLVYMRGGTYHFPSVQILQNKSGTNGSLIKIWAYPGETPVITKANPYDNKNTAVLVKIINVNFLHLNGLDISGNTQEDASVWSGLRAENVNHCIFELLNIHHNGQGMILTYNSTDNLILNCDFHENTDPISIIPWDNCDGLDVSSITNVNAVNTIRGCRAWWCGDGITGWANEGTLIFENCWSFWNGYVPGSTTTTSPANGNGYKLGKQVGSYPNDVKRVFKNCLAFENKESGFYQNNSNCKAEFYNNVSYHNGAIGFQLAQMDDICSTIKNNISYANAGPIGYFFSSSVLTTNTFLRWNANNTAYSVTNADFVSVSSTGMNGARQSDGSLPVLNYLHLSSSSDLVNSGTNVGLPFNGSAPDIGSFESNTSSSNQPPVIQNQTFQLNRNSSNGTVVGTVVATDPDAGQTLSYSILSGNTNSAFAINASTGKITVANSGALVNGTGGNNYSVFPSATPSISQNYIGTGTAPLEVGMKFRTSINGYVSGFRYYKGAGAQGTHIGNLWNITGTKLATATFTGETASGWQTVTLSTPVAITANTIYVVSYFSQHGDYVKTNPYFTADVVNGPLTRLGWTASQPNGVYRYTAASAFPNNNAYIGNTNYWADVIFTSSSTPTLTSFALAVKVQDNGTGNLSNQATITINLQ